jgi:hypothetical protein
MFTQLNREITGIDEISFIGSNLCFKIGSNLIASNNSLFHTVKHFAVIYNYFKNRLLTIQNFICNLRETLIARPGE